jgi:hypothetical protein
MDKSVDDLDLYKVPKTEVEHGRLDSLGVLRRFGGNGASATSC